MNTTYLPLHPIIIFIPLFLSSIISALNLDGTTLLSFKHSLLPHKSPLLQNWNQSDQTPCSWSGVTCAPQNGPVTALSLPNSHLSGSIPIAISRLQHLQHLNLSNNSINGTIPVSIFNFPNLQTLSLSSNFISGELPEIIPALQSLRFLNLSNNKISGFVLRSFAENIPVNAILDLSFNNLTGEIPQMFSNKNPEYFAGNLNLCGKPLTKTCIVPSSYSSHSLPPNVSLDGSATAAIAAIPKTGEEDKLDSHSHKKVISWKIIAIVVGDLAGMMTLVVFFYTYQFRKKNTSRKKDELVEVKVDEPRACCCFVGGTEEESETLTDNATDNESEGDDNRGLVMVDGETEMEMETLLKASAYVLGSSGGSIVYKAVVGGGGGGVFVVRRIGECGVEKMKDFEKIVRGLSKFRHRNLVKVLGFYWGEEEKLVIYEYVSNGNLASVAYGSSTCLLSFETRLKIVKGLAKGLSYIHEKKHVHGNMKPNNILLTPNMDPVISDFGLEWLRLGKINSTIYKSTSKREEPIITRNYHHHYHQTNNLYGYVSPYQAPESIKTSKSNPKWDVYSFGIILLELFSGKFFSDKELAQWNTDSMIADMETKILKQGNQSISAIDVHGSRKDCLLKCIELGFSCASLVPHMRPSMKEVLQVLEKISWTS